MTLRNQKGFTLIELVIVIVIIGILAAVAVPVYNNLFSEAETAAVEATDSSIQSALSIAIAEQDGSPTVSELTNFIRGSDVSANSGTLETTVNGTTYTADTYSTNDCSGTANSANSDTVKCVDELTES